MSDITTNMNIVYGPIRTLAQRQGLNLCIVAPRYALHDIDQYSDGFLTAYTGSAVNNKAWPARNATSTIDIAGSEAYAVDALLQINTTTLTAAVDSGSPNKLTFTEVIATGNGSTVNAALGAYSLRAGDTVYLTSGANNATAVITRVAAVTIAASVETPEAYSSNTGEEIPVSAGTFTGTSNVTYIAKVVSQTTTEVVCALTAIDGDYGYAATQTFTKGTAAAIGNYGATLKFEADTVYVANDSYIINCLPATSGAYKIAYIDTVLDTTDFTTGIAVVAATKNLTAAPVLIGDNYWTATQSVVNVGASMTLLVNGSHYTVKSCDVYLRYRELLTDRSLELIDATASDAAAFAGPADIDNPMGACYDVAMAAGTNTFYMMSVPEESLVAYQRAYGMLARYEDAYSCVPWNTDITGVITQTNAFVVEQSAPAKALFRMSWIASRAEKLSVVYGALPNGAAIVGTIDASSVLTLGTGSDAGAVAPGDTVTLYNVYDSETQSFSDIEYNVLSVTDATTVVLDAAAEQSTPVKVVFRRELTDTEYVDSVIADAAVNRNARINCIWADTVNYGGQYNVNKQLLCVALAALRGSLAPHAPLTDRVIGGITISDTLKLSDTDFRRMTANGVWVCANNTTGSPVTYHQVSTLIDGTIAQENSCVTNGDSIVREMRLITMPYRTSCNISTQLVETLRGKMQAQAFSIMSRSFSDDLGPQMTDFSITTLSADPDNDARLLGKFQMVLPKPYLGADYTFNLI